jgi:phenylalanine-4-hydroxylase
VTATESVGLEIAHQPDELIRLFGVDQAWQYYSDAEHKLWQRLHERQSGLLVGRAANEFVDGIHALDLHGGGIPDFEALSERLFALTGWRVIPVAGLIPDEAFFGMLAARLFPAARFLRREDQLDYISEPDIFHDVFGHVPMLTNPVFADYLQAYGAGGLRAMGFGALDQLARLYWYTVEFGLIETVDGLRIYGSGIVSSPSETQYAVQSAVPNRIRFDLKRVMRTLYEIDDLQKSYFVIKSYDELFEATGQDFAPIYRSLAGTETISSDGKTAGDIFL